MSEIFKNLITKIIFFASLFVYFNKYLYFSPLLLVTNLRKIVVNKYDLIILFSVIYLILVNVFIHNNYSLDTIIIIKYFLGVYFFYFIFKNFDNFYISIEIIFYAIIIFIFFEFLIKNIFIDINNFNKHNLIFISNDLKISFIKSLGPCYNSSCTSGLLILIHTFLKKDKTNFLLLIISILILNSGVGITMLILHIFMFFFLNNKKNIFFYLIIISFIIVFFKFNYFMKIDPVYFKILFFLKLNFIIEAFYNNFSLSTYLLTNLQKYYLIKDFEFIGYGGEQPYVYFFINFGMVGLLMIFSTIKETKLSSMSNVQLILLFISQLHYPFLVNLFGQIIFGYILFINKKELKKHNNDKLMMTK